MEVSSGSSNNNQEIFPVEACPLSRKLDSSSTFLGFIGFLGGGLRFVIHELPGIGRDVRDQFLALFFGHGRERPCEPCIFFKLFYVIASNDRSRYGLREGKAEKRLHGFKPR